MPPITKSCAPRPAIQVKKPVGGKEGIPFGGTFVVDIFRDHDSPISAGGGGWSHTTLFSLLSEDEHRDYCPYQNNPKDVDLEP
jgi:hypothetical protein